VLPPVLDIGQAGFQELEAAENPRIWHRDRKWNSTGVPAATAPPAIASGSLSLVNWDSPR
jgi:hypothetical protein